MTSWNHGYLYRFRIWSVGLVFGALMVATVKAHVLVSHAPADSGILSNSSSQNADFMFAGTASVTGISWWGTTLTNPDDLSKFEVRIFKGLDLPDSFIVASGTTMQKPAGVDVQGSPISRFDLDLNATLHLATGEYYLSILNESQNQQWFWQLGTGGDGNNHFRVVDDTEWVLYDDGDYSLELAVIPEPGSMALLLLAGTALLLTRRQVRRRQLQ